MAYKEDVDDLRESPSLKLLELLTQRGALVDYNDPYFPTLFKMRHYDFSDKHSVELTAELLASYDCVLIATDHSKYDYDAIVREAQARRRYPECHAAYEGRARKNRSLLIRGPAPRYGQRVIGDWDFRDWEL